MKSDGRRASGGVWVPLAMALIGLVLVPLQTAAQACTLLPVARDEIWFGGFGEFGGPSFQRGGAVGVNVADVVGAEFGLSWGGYEGATGGAEARVRAFSTLPDFPFCPFLEFRTVDYPFRDAFDLDYGDVAEEAYHAGIAFGGSALALGPAELRWRANVGGYMQVWKLIGRRLVIEGLDIYPQEIKRVDTSYHLTLLGAVTLVWDGVAVTAGAGNRPRVGDDTLLFVGVAFRGVNLGR